MNLSNILATGNVDITVTAGEGIAANDGVYIAVYGTVGLSAGNAYRTNASSPNSGSNAFVAGFALSAISSGTSGRVRIAGSLDGFVGLTPGALYYCASSAGAISTTKPAYPRLMGMAVSATVLVLNVRGANTLVYSGVTGTYGYVMGGFTSASTTSGSATAERVTFSADTFAAKTTANLSLARAHGQSGTVSQSGVKGYACGGVTSGSAGTQTPVTDKLTFSTETTAAQTTANLSVALRATAGVSEVTSKGYLLGGSTSNSNSAQSAIEQILTYSTDVTATNTSANLSQARWFVSGISDGSTKGYAGGGGTGTLIAVATTDKVTFSTDAISATTTANLTGIRHSTSALSNGSTKGYFMGGFVTSVGDSLLADKVTFSTDVTASVSTANLSVARVNTCGISEGSNKGYVSGGYTGATIAQATTDLVTYATDVSSAATTMNLNTTRRGPLGTSDVGW